MKNEIEDLRRTIEQAQAERSIDALKKTIFGGAAFLILFALLVGVNTVDNAPSRTASFQCSWTSGSSCQYSISHHKLCAGTYHPASGAFDDCVRGFGSEPDFRIVDALTR